MQIQAFKTELKEIQPFRELFLGECDFQIRYYACHERGWSDSWLVTADGVKIGYGAVKGKDDLDDRDAVFEFFVLPLFRENERRIFSVLLEAAGPAYIECQSNDLRMTSMLFEFARNISSDVVLFADRARTEFHIPGVIFRRIRENDTIFEHTLEPVGGYVLERDGEVVATGGFTLYYNPPFADLYMEVREDCRRTGLGSFLLQELKKECYGNGRVPAARCSMQNVASRAALAKAGFSVAGYMLTGRTV